MLAYIGCPYPLGKTDMKKLPLLVLLLGLVLILIPFITQNHVYQTIAVSSDIQGHSDIINRVTDGRDIGQIGYLAQGIFGWLLGMLNKVLKVGTYYLLYAFMAVVLMGVGITMYKLGSVIGGERTGWFVLIISVLCTTSILGLYSYGVIFSIINMYIVLAWAIIAFMEWSVKHRWYWLALSVALALLFAVLHPTGLYLPFAIVAFGIGSLIWQIIKKKKISWHYYLLSGIVVIGIFVLSKLYLNTFWVQQNIIWNNFDFRMFPAYAGQFFMTFLSPITTIIGILILFGWYQCRKELSFSPKLKIGLAILGSFAIVLIMGSILRVSSFPERLMLDASTVLAIIIGLVLGELIKRQELSWLKYSSYGFMGLGSLLTLIVWVR